MSGPIRRFDPAELRGLDGESLSDADAAAALRTARDLEEFARAESGSPSVGFEDRVMAAIVTEAPPLAIVRGGVVAGLVGAFRDAWRIASSGGRPMAVRAQALAFVLVAVLAVGSVGTLAAAGVARLLANEPTPAPTVDTEAPPTDELPAVPTPPTASPSPSATPSPSPTPSPTPTGSEEPSATPEDDGASGTSEPTKRPTARPTGTNEPEETEEPSEDHDGTPKPEDTPDPTKTPDPEDTPEPTD